MSEFAIKILIGLGAAIIAAFVALLLYFLKKKDDEINLIRNKISDKKYSVYFDAVNLFFDLLNKPKGIKNFAENELQLRYIELKKNVLLLGSDEIILKFLEIDKNTVISDKASVQVVMKFMELLHLIRKDAGNHKTKLTPDDLLKAIMASEKDYNDIKSILAS